MRMFTIRYCYHFTKWCAGLTKNVKLLATLFLLSSFFISENVFAQPGPGTAPVVPPTNGMAIDGFLQRQGTPGDWLAAPGGSTAGTYLFNSTAPGTPAISAPGLIFHKIDIFNDANDEGFDGGNKLFQDPNTWGWSSKKQLNKDDMHNAMVFITQNPTPDANGVNHIWALISGDRASENGTSYLDFEFYQTEITRTGPNQTGPPVLGGKGGFLTLGPHGGRTVGDLSVTLSFVSGGSLASVSILRWAPNAEGGGYDYLPLDPPIPAGAAYVAANTETVDVPYGAFGIFTYAPNLFVEAAIDLTALIGGTGGQCGGLNFKSLFIKTKSSAERTADLKDFIDPFSISLCSDRTPAVITSGGNQLALGCNPSASDINAALGTASASDNCVTPTLTSSDGTVQSSSCSRSQTRTWTAVDGCGNTTTSARTATWTADVTGPTLTTGGNNAALGCNPTASAINGALGTATATDVCGSVTITQSDGSVSSDGCNRQQTRRFTARDGCGNTSTAQRTANWSAAGTLTITCPTDRHLQCSDANTTTASTGVAVASGGCSPTVTSSDQTTTRNCAKLVKRTWIATDACGQTATCVQNIFVADDVPPVISNCNGDVTDNCTSSGNILKYFSNGVWTAIDESGNISTLNCNGARLAPTTNVVEETKPVVTETEKATSTSSKRIIVPLQPNNFEVYAYPNPYTDQVNFRFVSPETGTGKLELYDILGKKISEINIGTVQAGVERSVNYKIPALRRISMIYKLTVGNQSGNGKLISGSKNP